MTRLLVGMVGMAVWAGPVVAQSYSFFQNSSGLASPANTITFSELGPIAPNTAITNQFQAYGATFSSSLSIGGLYYNPTVNQTGNTPHLDNDNVGNYIQNGEQGPFRILFTGQVTEAAFALGAAPGTAVLTARLAGVDKASATFVRDGGPTFTDNFVGFTTLGGATFDELVVNQFSGNNATIIDNLQFTPVPEPSAGVLVVAVGVLAWQRRRRTRRCT